MREQPERAQLTQRISVLNANYSLVIIAYLTADDYVVSSAFECKSKSFSCAIVWEANGCNLRKGQPFQQKRDGRVQTRDGGGMKVESVLQSMNIINHYPVRFANRW